MSRNNKCSSIFISLTLIMTLTLSSSSTSHSSNNHHETMKGGYFPSWAQDFTPSSINTKLFTHIFYAFLTPNNTTFKFQIDHEQAHLLTDFTSTLHLKKSPKVVAMFSVGGAGEGTTLFSRMASNPSSRMIFIVSSIETARKFDFDGIDLDWEFPRTPGEMENLGYLLKEWRSEVENEAAATGKPRLLLSAAVYYSSEMGLSGPERSYPSDSIGKNLDWINVMNYDYHGSWDTSVTGSQAALFDPESNVSTSYGLGSWIRAGVPRSKVVMGLPLYGRTWELRDKKVSGIGAPAVDVGPSEGERGVLTYAEIVKFNKDHKAKVVYDHVTVSVYSTVGTSWIGYDDPRSVSAKISYAKGLGIRGYFFWAIDDDYKWEISKTASESWSL